MIEEVALAHRVITLESEKASMDVPSPAAGKVLEIHVEVGAKVEAGNLILTLEATEEEAAKRPDSEPAEETKPASVPADSQAPKPSSP